MKAFEYMASGRAILTSDLEVLTEVLDGEISVLLPPEDVNAWDQALKSLSVDRARRSRLSEAARDRAARYSWKARAERTLAGLGDG
jgi:glycosyltransferase involved in cell wall biosynthesis